MTRAELLKTAKPILFNTEMVRAILDGRKTVTRRVMSPQPRLIKKSWVWSPKMDLEDTNINHYESVWNDFPGGGSMKVVPCSAEWNHLRYKPGDILYVREAFAPVIDYIDGEPETVFAYKASTPDNQYVGNVMSLPITAWHPSIHMPKEAARLFLRVTDVRVERLQEIDADGIRNEGLTSVAVHVGDMEIAQSEFALLWDSTVKKSDLDRYGWAANPWVWCIEFERIEVQE